MEVPGLTRSFDESAPLQVILNPAASGGAGVRLQAEVEASLARRGIPFRVTRTEAPGHARALSVDFSRAGEEVLLVVGGDGTIHEVANGCLEAVASPPALGIVPVGTGNDFFRMVGGSREVEEALEALVHGSVARFDVGRVRFKGTAFYFVNLLGVGVDVRVLEKRETFRRLRGLPQYLAALVSALLTFRPEPIRITLQTGSGPDDTEVIEGRTILTAATVGPSVGGGFMLNPDASPEDGLLNLFFVDAVGPLKIARYVPRVIQGTHGDLPDIQLRTFSRAVVERPDGGPFSFELDGERMPDPVNRLEIDVCRSRLPVLMDRRTS